MFLILGCLNTKFEKLLLPVLRKHYSMKLINILKTVSLTDYIT